MSWKSLSKFRSELMGLACLWVILHHNSFDWPNALESLERFALYGNLGVDIFLLLSGVGLYYAWAKQPKLGDFYARRFVRLLVPYVLFAVPYWAWKDLYLGHGSFLMDVTQLSLPLKGIITTWYIPAIAVMYLLYPLIAKLLFSGDRWTRTVVLCGTVMLGCLHFYYRDNAIYDNCEIALTRTVIFIIGCALGKSVKDDEPIAPHLPVLGLLWIMLNAILRRHVSLGDAWIRFSYIPLCLSVVLVALWVMERLEGFASLRSFLRFFGERSLELYLTHVLIRNVFYHYIPIKQFDQWGVLTYGVILSLSLVVSTLLHPVINKLCSAILARKETV